jgi:hypothetical protein
MTNETGTTPLTIAEQNLEEAIKQLGKVLAAEPKAAAGAVLPDSTMRTIINFINQAKSYFTDYITPLTSTDRRRLFGAGFKFTGFIDAAYAGVAVNQNLLPAYMPAAKFKEDADDFTRKHNLYIILDQFAREASDVMLVSSDNAYRNSLDYYSSIKDAARRHVAGAEAEYNRLKPFFKKSKPANSEPTEAEVERDVRALLHGTKEGRVIVENKLPDVSSAKRKVIDEVQSSRAAGK